MSAERGARHPLGRRPSRHPPSPRPGRLGLPRLFDTPPAPYPGRSALRQIPGTPSSPHPGRSALRQIPGTPSSPYPGALSPASDAGRPLGSAPGGDRLGDCVHRRRGLRCGRRCISRSRVNAKERNERREEREHAERRWRGLGGWAREERIRGRVGGLHARRSRTGLPSEMATGRSPNPRTSVLGSMPSR